MNRRSFLAAIVAVVAAPFIPKVPSCGGRVVTLLGVWNGKVVTVQGGWKNWTAAYTSISKEDLVASFRKASKRTEFVPPISESPT